MTQFAVSLKVCSKCGQTKELSYFSKNTRRPDGLNLWCRACVSISGRAWRERNPEKIKAKTQRYTADGRGAEQSQRYRKRHPDMIKALRERYRVEGRSAEWGRRQRKRCGAAIRAAADAWRGANPQAIKAHHILEYALKRGDLTRSDACELCGASNVRLHGHHPNYENPLDVVWLCPSCHSRLHKKEPKP